MYKFLFYGIGIVALSTAISMPLGRIEMGVNIAGLIGTILLVSAGILSGSFISGDRIRANYSYSLNHDRNKILSMKLMMIGLPGLAVVLIYYMYR